MIWSTLSLLAALPAAAALIALRHWMVRVEPHRITITRHEVIDPDLTQELDGLTICQVSDVHMTAEGRNAEAIAQAIRSISADLYVLTGDMIHRESGINSFFRWFDELGAAIRPCVAILGNAEHKPGIDTRKVLCGFAARGVPVLNNAVYRFPLPQSGAMLQIVGVDDPVTAYDNFDRAFAAADPEAWTLFLCHTPDGAINLKGRRVDLMLTGHTHGGQVRFPILGAPVQNIKHARGLVMGWYEGEELQRKAKCEVGKTRLYVSRGLGMSRFPGRLLCPPELALFTLRRKKK